MRSGSNIKNLFIVGVVLFVVLGLTPISGVYGLGSCEKTVAVAYEDGDQYSYVRITRPGSGYNYINDQEYKKIDGVEYIIIIGNITIKADASSDINKVIFFINDMDTFTDQNAPWEWVWDFKLAIGLNKITVRGYDNDQMVAEDSVYVLTAMINDVSTVDSNNM